MHPVSTPLDPGVRLSKEQSPQNDSERSEMSQVPYSQLVGALMYLAIATRPDIAHSVGVLARFSSNPGMAHCVKLAIEGVSANFALKHTVSPVSPADLCECKGLYYNALERTCKSSRLV